LWKGSTTFTLVPKVRVQPDQGREKGKVEAEAAGASATGGGKNREGRMGVLPKEKAKKKGQLDSGVPEKYVGGETNWLKKQKKAEGQDKKKKSKFTKGGIQGHQPVFGETRSQQGKTGRLGKIGERRSWGNANFPRNVKRSKENLPPKQDGGRC